MTTFDAVSIAEGFCGGENATEEEKVEAWQHLIDTGAAYTLQGWFGREAERLIEAGICHRPEVQGHIPTLAADGIKKPVGAVPRVPKVGKVKVVNVCKKKRPVDNPYEVWKSRDGSWTWYVLKKNQADDNKPYAICHCFVTSPIAPDGEYGDCYVRDVKQGNTRVSSNY